MKKLIMFYKIIGLLICVFIFNSCSIEWKPWKTVWYYEKKLYKNNESPISGFPSYPHQSEFDSKKYSAYYIDNLFVGIVSDRPRLDFQYEHILSSPVEIIMEAYDGIGIEKIIIHNIRIISNSKINYSYILNETFPIEIPIDGEYAEELKSGTTIFRGEYIKEKNPNSISILYDSRKKINFNKTEPFFVYIDLELIKNTGSVKKEIKFTMKPKINRCLLQFKPVRPLHFLWNAFKL